jgi:hypothetical protein
MQHPLRLRATPGAQQTYARKCGVFETLPPTELVEDALRMNSAAFERYGVAVVREFNLELTFDVKPINHEHARGTTNHFIGPLS